MTTIKIIKHSASMPLIASLHRIIQDCQNSHLLQLNYEKKDRIRHSANVTVVSSIHSTIKIGQKSHSLKLNYDKDFIVKY